MFLPGVARVVVGKEARGFVRSEICRLLDTRRSVELFEPTAAVGNGERARGQCSGI